MYIIQNKINYSSGKSEELFLEVTSENAVRYCADIQSAKRFNTFESAKQELDKILKIYSKLGASNCRHIFAIYWVH